MRICLSTWHVSQSRSLNEESVEKERHPRLLVTIIVLLQLINEHSLVLANIYSDTSGSLHILRVKYFQQVHTSRAQEDTSLRAQVSHTECDAAI